MSYSLIIILVIIVLTWVMRLLPVIIFGRGGQIPEIIVSLGSLLPPAVMVLLIVYCIRKVSVFSTPFGIPELVGIAMTVIIYKLTKNSLAAMVLSTIAYMLMVQVVF